MARSEWRDYLQFATPKGRLLTWWVELSFRFAAADIQRINPFAMGATEGPDFSQK